MNDPAIRFACPVSRGRLRWVERDELLRLVVRPEAVAESVSGAFVSEQAGLAYPMDDGIHVFVPDQALATRGTAVTPAAEAIPRSLAMTEAKTSVRAWYDSFGWVPSEDGTYGDSRMFSYTDRNSAKRYEVLSHLSLVDKLGTGDLLLDAASGAIAHREYLSYSLFFGRRVCVDFSRQALRQARGRLGASGIYVLADICQLPFEDETFDAVSSLYTIQHIPADDQSKAVEELYRTLKRSGRLVLVNAAPVHDRVARRLLLLPIRALHKLIGRSASVSQQAKPVEPQAGEQDAPVRPLYTHLRAWDWWAERGTRLGGVTSVEVFRFFRHDEVGTWFGRSADAIQRLLAAEQVLGRLLVGSAAYLLVRIVKR